MTIFVETEWVAAHRLEVETEMESTGWQNSEPGDQRYLHTWMIAGLSHAASAQVSPRLRCGT